MNIAVQCCGMAVLLILFLFYIQKKTLGTRTESLFRGAFSAIAICLCMDILSIVAISEREQCPSMLVNAVCKLYLVSLVVSVLFALLYLCADMIRDGRHWHRCVQVYVIFALILSLSICIAPIYIYDNALANEVYTYGAATMITYVGVLAMIVNNLVLLFSQKQIDHRRRRAVTIWMCLWIGAAVVQFVHKELLIVGFAAAMGIMVVYLQFENPELNLDKQTGLFNQGAFIMYMKQIYEQKQELPVLSVWTYRNNDGGQLENVQSQILQQIADILLTIPNICAFRVNEAEFLILFRKIEGAADVAVEIHHRLESAFQLYGETVCKARYIYTENLQIVGSGSELLELMHYVRVKNGDTSLGRLLKVDAQTAESLFHIKKMGHQINSALEHDRIVVYYQPIYSVKEQCFTSAEALVRMIDDEGKLIMPGEFIRVAEENGIIGKLGERVFEKVCHFFMKQNLQQYGIEFIEVNLSAIQAADENLAQDYIRIMEKQQIEPRYINLEITESASVSAKNILLNNMNALMERGVRFSLDDFGTGQSNLNYIVEMPVHIVKFDREMTNAYFENGKAKYVMDAAMHMIHGMNLSIVAEGVETASQMKTMEQLGIQYIQGYYYSKPLSEEHFLEFIKEKNADKSGGVA